SSTQSPLSQGIVKIPDLPRPSVNQPSTPHNFVPAEVLLRVRPEISEGIRSRITRETVVLVKVNIDATGRVTRATPITRGDSVITYVGLRASEAARSWRFEPAKNNSIPAPSSQVIRFVFEP
ncbi:MAG: TonB family protein, partial [Acidobacteriota bacterium]|nr:TonB family protein [Acidobacteriota bacterium]